MSNTPDLGPVPQRITVDAEQVRRLVEQQFAQWAGLPVQPVVNGGWDNWTFHLGAEMLVRLPSAAEYALAVDKEHRWLAALAPQLPLPIPVPLAKGEPGMGYPYPWSIYQWLSGEPASADRIADPVRFAADLAGFLTALRSVDPSVIDFGTCGVGDPACDLAIAWTLLTADGRQAFREQLSAGEAEWARGRGWALWKTLATCAYSLGDDDEQAVSARRVLGEIFSEYAIGR